MHGSGDSWVISRSEDSSIEFTAGHIGPYRLGPTVRKTGFGEVIVAEIGPRVVELDMLDALASGPLAGDDAKIMADIAHVVGLQHRHIATVIGSGIEDGVPYVVREHRLGRTLACLLERAPRVSLEIAAAVLHGTADALAFLADQGPQPGSCSMGGFEPRDIFLGFGGDVLVTGVGLQQARHGDDDPLAADLQATFALARNLDEAAGGGLMPVVASSGDLPDLARRVRKAFGDACGARPRHVGAELRAHFADEIREVRAFFGLHTLQ